MRKGSPHSVCHSRRLLSAFAWLLVVALLLMAQELHLAGRHDDESHAAVAAAMGDHVHADHVAADGAHCNSSGAVCGSFLALFPDAGGVIPRAGLIPVLPQSDVLLDPPADRLYRPPIHSIT